MITPPTSPRIFAKIVAEAPNLRTQIQREEWVARQRKKRQRSALTHVLSRCASPREVIAAVTSEAGNVSGVGMNAVTHTGICKVLRRHPLSAHASRLQSVPRIIPRPTHVIRESHRPSLIPALADSTPPPRSLAPLNEILDQLDTRIATGQHPYAVLDWLHSITAIPWPRCAEVSRARGQSIDDDAVKMVSGARNFWDRLGEFRHTYRNAVALGQVPSVEGAWGIVDAAELAAWLPGLHVPRMHIRQTFLVRVVPRGKWHDLDFHGFPSYRALFRLPM